MGQEGPHVELGSLWVCQAEGFGRAGCGRVSALSPLIFSASDAAMIGDDEQQQPSTKEVYASSGCLYGSGIFAVLDDVGRAIEALVP